MAASSLLRFSAIGKVRLVNIARCCSFIFISAIRLEHQGPHPTGFLQCAYIMRCVPNTRFGMLQRTDRLLQGNSRCVLTRDCHNLTRILTPAAGDPGRHAHIPFQCPRRQEEGDRVHRCFCQAQPQVDGIPSRPGCQLLLLLSPAMAGGRGPDVLRDRAPEMY
jgi:hypothetical protein